MDAMQITPSIVVSVIVGACSFLFVLAKYFGVFNSSKKIEDDDNNSLAAAEKHQNSGNGATKPLNQGAGDHRTSQQKSKAKGSRTKSTSDEFKHPLLVTTLKGHGGYVTSFDLSSSGKYLISTATDRSVFLWSIKELGNKGLKSVRATVEYDSAQLIKFSPDNKSFITSLENGNCIRVFKLSKNEDGSLGKVQQALDDFPKTMDDEIINIGIDSAGNYVMTADSKTHVDILNLRGEKLITLDTATMKNAEASVSPCGRFVAVCGFTPDVKIWELIFDKNKSFKSAKRVFDLKGHTAGVLSLAFSADSSRIATASKDSTWKLWKADIEYGRGQDPVLLCTGVMDEKVDHAKVAITPDGRTVAIAIENNVTVYNGITQEKDVEIKAMFSSSINHLMFSVDGRFLFCCGDKQVKVFNNPTGYKSKISDLSTMLQSCNKNMERRLTDQLNEAREALKIIESTDA